MTRLLVPEVFGVMAIAIIVDRIVALLSDVGLHQSIIHSRRGNSTALLNTAWTVQIIRGFLIWFVCIAIAGAIYWLRIRGVLAPDSVYAAPELPPVIAAVAFGSVIRGFESTNVITAHRNLDLKRLTQSNLAAQIFGLIVMGILGWWMRSIWAFVIGIILQAVLFVFLSHRWLPGARNRFAWESKSVNELTGYGRWVLLSSSVSVLAQSGDRLLLGGWTDAATLGLYSLAFNLSIVLSDAGGTFFASVGMPAMSETVRESPEKLRRLYFRMRLPFDLMFLMGAGFLFAAGQWVIDLLYDDRYAYAGRMLQILSFSLVFARFAMAHHAYLALGKPRNFFLVNCVKIVAVYTLVPAAFYLFGLEGAIWAIAIHMAPTLALVYFLNREYGLNSLRFEAMVLLAWPVGYWIGWSFERLL